MTTKLERLLPAPPAKLELRPVASIDVRAWDEIWRLTCRFYDAERPFVERRLKAHQQIALLRTVADQRLVGMVALEDDVFTFEGRNVAVVFSSHAVVDPRYRDENPLQRAGLRGLLHLWAEHPLKRKFWAYDAAGDQSEALLPWLQAGPPPAPWETRLLAAYGERKFGSAWVGGGTIRHPPQMRRLVAPGDGQLRLARLGPGVAWALLRQGTKR